MVSLVTDVLKVALIAIGIGAGASIGFSLYRDFKSDGCTSVMPGHAPKDFGIDRLRQGAPA